MFARVKSLLTSVEGPTTVEYAVMLALIVLAAIGGITALGVRAVSYTHLTLPTIYSV